MPENILLYKFALGLIPGLGPVTTKKVVAYTGGVEAIFTDKKEALQKLPINNKALFNKLNASELLSKAEKEIEFVQKNGIKPLFYLDKEYPTRLKNCEDSPVMLFVKGDVDFDRQKVISIVGTRNVTSYGKDICENFAKDLVAKGHDAIIVSGLAYGVDIAAHKSALKNGLDTVGVVAHGLDRVYPAAHKSVAHQMQEQGAMVSEFWSNTIPDRQNFVKRNRIIAGLSDATIVVESGFKGGSLITADIANSYNRDVFAFPGRIKEAYSKGCNKLIKSNKAALIEGVEDLEYILGWEKKKKKMPVQRSLFIDLSPEEKRLVEELKSAEQLSIDELCVKLDLPVSKAATTLVNLEFAGVIKSMPGSLYRLV